MLQPQLSTFKIFYFFFQTLLLFQLLLKIFQTIFYPPKIYKTIFEQIWVKISRYYDYFHWLCDFDLASLLVGKSFEELI